MIFIKKKQETCRRVSGRIPTACGASESNGHFLPIEPINLLRRVERYLSGLSFAEAIIEDFMHKKHAVGIYLSVENVSKHKKLHAAGIENRRSQCNLSVKN